MPSDSLSAGPRGDLPNVNRLLASSDGVVAIAITLLVPQLNMPSPAKLHDPNSASELARYLGNGADRLVSYVILPSRPALPITGPAVNPLKHISADPLPNEQVKIRKPASRFS